MSDKRPVFGGVFRHACHVRPKTTLEHPAATASTLSMVAEMELGFITERLNTGIAAAKKKGVYKGGTRKADYARVQSLLASGLTKAEVAGREKTSRETFYQIIRAM
jgi:DNA invertase Pin-like site-specific DNA recombinase